ncbi:MAG: FIST C-terminal domain-containing protein [Verrucomicrobia bacterium]|nr:FIST C-terminal domain-containing protein [Verrucomicrobiota bacterium]
MESQQVERGKMHFLETPDSAAVRQIVNDMERGSGDAMCVLVSEASKELVPEIISSLTDMNVPFFGGLFPGVLYMGKKLETGAVLVSLPMVIPPRVVRHGDEDSFDFLEVEEGLAGSGNANVTALVLVDGLSPNISSILEELFNRLGNTVHYLGGGAGSLSLKQQPCLFTADEGFFQDAAIVAFVDLPSRLGVRHGWNRLVGPFVATRTSKNVIKELNWKNAFDVYASAVGADAKSDLTKDNFFDIAKCYPFGMIHEGTEDVVRDPVAVTEDGFLVCVGDVPENSILHILKGTPATLVQAAGQAAEDAVTPVDSRCLFVMVADCISRAIFLGEDFGEELKAVRCHTEDVLEGRTCGGMLTIGEISSHGEGLIEFFNKTVVVGSFYGR